MTPGQQKEINRLIALPRIDRIRKGWGPTVQKTTYDVVKNYVLNKSKYKKHKSMNPRAMLHLQGRSLAPGDMISRMHDMQSGAYKAPKKHKKVIEKETKAHEASESKGFEKKEDVKKKHKKHKKTVKPLKVKIPTSKARGRKNYNPARDGYNPQVSSGPVFNPQFKKHKKTKPQGKGIVKALGQKSTTGNFAKIQKAKGKGAAIAALQNKLAKRRGNKILYGKKKC